MWTRQFWKAAGERAARTAAQTLIALWAVAGPFNALAINWEEAAGVTLGACLLSLLTSIAAGKVSPATGPSLGTERPVGQRRA